jgi:23S rRNA (cytidine1920-2'-O)/16S rRNA (cytidine1409-2'-O)-methyltransferase
MTRPRSSKRARADLLLVERGLCESRTKAKALIMAGQVFRGEERVDKPGDELPVDAPLELRGAMRFVSRGGDKLDHALAVFADHGLDVAGRVCVDVGASTGGFSDCLLQRAALKVYAVDVGYGQLHPRLRDDPRIEVRERTNARALGPGDFAEPIEVVVVDASFIGIGKLLGAIASFVPAGGTLVALIKPQFEAGREVAARARGVIRDEEVRRGAIERALEQIEEAGFTVVATTDSPLRGPKGNLEHFVLGRRR